MKKSRIFLAALCILSFVGHLLVYPQLPETVPTHWGLNGEVNGWSSKPTLLFLSLLPLLLLVLLEVVPKIDPRGQNYKKHEKAYDIMILMTTLLMIGVSWISTAAALGYPVKVEQWVPLGIGLLFLALGNYMPQIRPNYTFGIKTPWTIENEWVWKKTHACGGILFCIMGVLMILSGFFTTRWLATLSLVFILGSVFWLFLYSYLLYRKWLRGESNK